MTYSAHGTRRGGQTAYLSSLNFPGVGHSRPGAFSGSQFSASVGHLLPAYG